MMKKHPENRKILRKILHYLKPYWFFMLCSVVLAAVSALLSLYLPVLIGNTVDLILDKGNVDFNALAVIFAKMAAIIGTVAAAQWLMNTCNNHIAYETVRDIREAAMAKIQELPLSYLDKKAPGEIVSRMVADVDAFADGLLLGFTQFFTGVLTILGTLVLMIRMNLSLALIVLVLTPLSLFVAAFIARKTYTHFRRQATVRAAQTTIIEEMIGEEKLVQAFSYEDEADKMFEENNKELSDAALKATFISSLTNPSTRFVNNMVYAAVALFGAYAAMRQMLSVGQLTAFLSYANQYTKPFNEISGVVTELQNAIACAGRVFELIEEAPQVPEDADAVILTEALGTVELRNVHFSYTQERKLIEDVNLSVRPGQRIAIVGPTGCGKTTLINLLMRFYDVDRGQILTDGTDIRHLTRRSLRASYGMVLQETYLKPGTIRENIVMGRPEASEEEMIEAARRAHAHGFIRQLPAQYDTVIGEDGGMLSQGQKQLICIARIMLSLPPMLILDEATSSIDTRTEAKIQDAFAKMMQGRTSFVVAHRLSTIREADCILVMRDGNIIEQGDHESLLRQGGFYRELYESQWAH